MLAFMSLQRGTFLSPNELCKLSGLSMSALNTREITCGQLGGLLGNSYSPQMIARVLSSGLMALAEQCGMARVQVPDNFKDGSYRGYESGEVLIEGMDRDPALEGPTGTWLGPDGVPEQPRHAWPAPRRRRPGRGRPEGDHARARMAARTGPIQSDHTRVTPRKQSSQVVQA